MKKYIRFELQIDGKVIEYTEIKITKKTTIKKLLKEFEKFLEETN